MGLFWTNKRSENVDPTYQEQLKRMQVRITKLEAETLELMTALDIIRNKVLRKIQFKKEDKEEEETNTWSGIPLT